MHRDDPKSTSLRDTLHLHRDSSERARRRQRRHRAQRAFTALYLREIRASAPPRSG
jgi:hypothetical protein